jgi:LysM repeat protein
MQQNKYGVYGDGGYQVTYDYVVKSMHVQFPSYKTRRMLTQIACELHSGTVTTPSGGRPVENTIPAPTCQSGRSYIAKSGDTCNSIAKINLVSSGSLFAMNPMLLDCTAIQAGAKLCLPPSCEKVRMPHSCAETLLMCY